MGTDTRTSSDTTQRFSFAVWEHNVTNWSPLTLKSTSQMKDSISTGYLSATEYSSKY